MTLLREHEISPDLVAKFSGLVGALLYAAPCARPDVNQTVSLLARALTFPTPELMRCAERALLYLAHTSELGMTIDGNLPDAEGSGGRAIRSTTPPRVIYMGV